MYALVSGTKQSDNVNKVRAQGPLHAKKKRTLNRPDKRRGRGKVCGTQLQVLAVVGRSQGLQEQPP